jgi:hypothetical protein
VYYVTAHGYGHGARSCDILRAVHRQAPDREIVVVSDLPRGFFASRLAGVRVRFRSGAFDVGLAQRDSIRADVAESLRRLQVLYARRRALVEQERRFLREVSAALVVADIPAMPLEAARAAGCRTAAVGNFGWNWIYGAFCDRDPAWGGLVDAIEEGYRCADLLVRLPFCEPMAIFDRREDVGVTAEPGTPDRERLAALTGADPARSWVLLSFTSLDWGEDAVRRVAGTADHAFFTVLPLAWEAANMHPVDPTVMPFSDILATCDLVVSKPGYGIVAECVANRKPLLHAERTDFLEYPVLVDAIASYLPQVRLSADDLYAGRLEDGLAALAGAPPPPGIIAMGGADQAARILLGLVGGSDLSDRVERGNLE